jgi:hypothetical protein
MADITLREVQESDLPRLGEFLTRGFPEIAADQWGAQFAMYWEENPWFDPASTPRGWMLERDSLPLGFIGNIPLRFSINGVESPAAAATSWYIDPEIRGIHSIQLFSSFHTRNQASLYLQTTPRPYLHTILNRYRYERLVLPFNRTEYLGIVDFPRALRLLVSFMKRNQQVNHSSPDAKGFLSYLPHLSAQIAPQDTDDLVCSLAPSCDPSFEALWQTGQEKKRCYAELARNTKTLNWLCFSGAVRKKRRMIQCRDAHDDSLLGYMVFDVEYPLQVRIPVLQLKDAFIPDDRESVVRAMIAHAFSLAQKEHVSLLTMTPWNYRAEKYLNASFKLRRPAENEYFYRFAEGMPAQRPAICASLIDPDRGCL